MSRHKMSHRKQKRAVLTALVLVAAAAVLVAAGILIGRALTYQEPVPIGTPKQNPVVDQRPVSSSSSSSEAGGEESSSQAASLPESAASSAAASSFASSSAAEPGADPEGTQCVRGTITDVTTSQITIVNESGQRLSFFRETADVTGRLVEEATVDIYYTGAISGTDTSAAYVTKIVSYA